MSKHKRKFLSMTLIIIFMLVGVVPVPAYAAEVGYVQEEENVIPLPINYIVVDVSCVEIGDTQNIVVGIGDGTAEITDVYLLVTKEESGNVARIPLKKKEKDAYLFSTEYLQKSESGKYQVTGIIYELNGNLIEDNFSYFDTDIVYGVNQVIDTNPDEVVVEETPGMAEVGEVTVYTFDEAGNALIQDDIPEAIAETSQNVPTTRIGRQGGNIVVVLDPGHDNTHTGASNNGLKEQELNLKIAKYCKEELEKYKGITVYLTRPEDGSCPYPGTTSKDCNIKRTEYAKSVGADVYVSIHLNSASSSAAKGAEIYYPTANYKPELGTEGKHLADEIIQNLVALGLENRGIKAENYKASGNPEYIYPDGSVADNYLVIRESKRRGIPAILIEHAFLTNQADVSRYLSDEAGLKKLGVADATGIAKNYGLTKSNIEGIAYAYRDDRIDVGVAYVSTGTNTKFRWLCYDLKTEQWELLSDWSSGNWITWKPKKGNYWLHVEMVNDEGDSASKTVCFQVDKNYSSDWVELKNICYLEREKRYDVGVFYEAGSKNVEFRWLAYDLKEKKWELISDWSSGNWASWYPDRGDYWLYVEGRSANGKVESETICFHVDKNCSTDWVELNNICYLERENRYDVGVFYEAGSENVEFRWLAYDLKEKKWELISDWKSGNWASWYPNCGNYWLHVECRNAKGKVQSTTIVFRSEKDFYTNSLVVNDVVCTMYEDRVAAGAVYTSGASDDVEFRWMEYNKETEKWKLLSDWKKGNWVNWTPHKGNYLLYVEARNAKGLTRSYAKNIEIDKNRFPNAINFQSIGVLNGKFGIDVGVAYETTASEVMFRYLIYDVSKKQWSLLHDWTKSNWATWYPYNGNYWIYIEAVTEYDTSESICIAYTVNERTSIMGVSETTLEQMMKYYQANEEYPEFYQTTASQENDGAPTLERFCQLYLEECALEGVRAEVAFCQAMKETGFLRYKGDVSREQLNFAGIGATGNGAPGYTFSTVREGIRAQIQHLKAYASKELLNSSCVDPRFSNVSRETSPYVEWLGQGENPYGAGWAVSQGYGYDIKRSYMAKLMSY